MSAEQPVPQDFFAVGGTLDADAPSYVAREADAELLRLLQIGQFCYVLTPRQMGKSSLMIRTAQRLQAEGTRIAMVDLSNIGTHLQMKEWYLSLLSKIHGQLRLSIDYLAWWKARSGLSPAQRFSDFMRQVVLEEVPGQVVIFVDEIDSTLSLDFSDDFFAAIRSIYNARASDPTYRRLTFVLLGVATPGDLIEDRKRTPFNIGQGVRLREFGQGDGGVLQEGLEKAFPGEGRFLLKRIYHWTSGHPYLTQRLCAAAVESKNGPWTEARVDALVKQELLAKEARLKDHNLGHILRSVEDSPENRQLLHVYRRVRRGEEVPDEERSAVKSRLKVLGLVKATPRGMLQVRNRVYEQVFDLTWVNDVLPKDRTFQILTASLLVVLAAVVVAGIVAYLLIQQQAEFYIDQFLHAATAEVRVSSLAGLMGLPLTEQEAQSLFFERLTPEEQVAMFELSDPKDMSQDLITVAEGLYPELGNALQDARILEAMIMALEGIDDPEAQTLVTELKRLLQRMAEYYADQFRRIARADVRVSTLAGLMGLRTYEPEAQDLFFDDLTPEEQVAMFELADPETVSQDLIAVAEGLQSGLGNTLQDDAILEAMIMALDGLDDPEAKTVTTDLKQLQLDESS